MERVLGRRNGRWISTGLLLLVLLVSITVQAEEGSSTSQSLTLGAGLVSASQLDRGYSPLIFSGTQAAVEATYARERGERE